MIDWASYASPDRPFQGGSPGGSKNQPEGGAGRGRATVDSTPRIRFGEQGLPMRNRLLHAVSCLVFMAGLGGALSAAEDSGPSATRMTPFVKMVQRACDSTVNIHTVKRQKSIDVAFSLQKGASKINGMGTGVLIDERGYILTNNHVIQDVESIEVTRNNGEKYIGTVFQTDPKNDLAIIRIHSRGPLPVMPIGTSSDLMLGEDVIAIGNAYGYEHSVTRGIVSALGRNVEAGDDQAYENLIQTDAAINPGNSGGPLINSEGEVIGINVAIRAGATKIGFAIPIDAARIVAAKMMAAEKTSNLYHGAVVKDHKSGAIRRLLVQSVRPGSPAAAAGLQSGDVVMRIGSLSVIDGVDFERAFMDHKPSESLPLLVSRSGKEESLNLQLAAASSDHNMTRQTVVANMPATPAPTTNTGRLDRPWDALGMRLTPLVKGDSRLEGLPYTGGMMVTDVRKDSPASQSGIRKGDILVGLSSYETVKENDVNYVLGHADQRNASPLKFYIVRERDTLFGFFSPVKADRTAAAN
jgi:serine protease Do